MEPLEDVGELVLGDPAAGVAHLEHDLVCESPYSDTEMPPEKVN